jgi:hypothetical protein
VIGCYEVIFMDDPRVSDDASDDLMNSYVRHLQSLTSHFSSSRTTPSGNGIVGEISHHLQRVIQYLDQAVKLTQNPAAQDSIKQQTFSLVQLMHLLAIDPSSITLQALAADLENIHLRLHEILQVILVINDPLGAEDLAHAMDELAMMESALHNIRLSA